MDIKTLKKYKKSLPKDKIDSFDMYQFMHQAEEMEKKLDAKLNHEKLNELRLQRDLLVKQFNDGNKNGE